jgi:hypothetical protein
VDPVKVAKT